MSELNILFSTNFSDSCFRAIRAVAQIADAFAIQLTISHSNRLHPVSQRDLHSFFAEADHFSECRRVALEGPPAESIAAFARREKFDLIIAPGSDRLGLPRPFHRSIRAGLIRSVATPVWTTSRALEAADFRPPIRTVAVALDGWDSSLRHLNLAASFAERIGARLRILTVIPAVSEGSLATQAVMPQPLHSVRARARIEELLSHWHRTPEVDVAVGSASREIPRMAARCSADLLFLSESQSLAGMFVKGVSRTVNHSPCPVICTPDSVPNHFKWSFQIPAAARKAALLETVPA
ncbi:MAG: universal stress protein [Saprospiraceae bacterium]